MEIRFSTIRLLLLGFSTVVLGSNFLQKQTELGDSKSKEEVNPHFIIEPNDEYLLPDSRAHLYCEAKFVSNLEFNCSGGLVPEMVLQNKDENNVTLIIADVSYAMFKARDLDRVSCVCLATGYKGLVVKSRMALIGLAYLNKDFIILPSAKVRVAKNSIAALRCQPPTGLPIPNVSWEKDGQPVVPLTDGRVQEAKQGNLSILLIRKAKTSDLGNYRCVASNSVGTRRSAVIKVTVYVDGGWSDWWEFSPCSATKCGNGTRMLKRSCTNPDPENNGKFCSGRSFKFEKCQDICQDLEIMCPNDTKVILNRSDTVWGNISWSQPVVINRKNGTKVVIDVKPSWAIPPVVLRTMKSTVITYIAKHEYGQTVNCSFNITLLNDTSSACSSKGCTVSKAPTATAEIPTLDSKMVHFVTLVLLVFSLTVALSFAAFYMRFRHKKLRTLEASESEFLDAVSCGKYNTESCKTSAVDSSTLLIRCEDSYSVPAASSTKLRAGSPTIQSGGDFDLEPSFKFAGVSSQLTDTESLKEHEDATLNNLSCRRKENYKRTNSSLSYKSTSSEISRMIWNITNLPENTDPNMVAWGLVDHSGGKFTIGDTGVSLIVPPQAIPEGQTEGIFIAIVNQEEEHPQLGGEEALLSPVVKCGPNGIKFQRPVILSMPHCALLENGAWNLKVQYNENEPGVPSDWKQLTDANKQDGSEPNLALLEADMVHLMVDHFTNFAVTGECASSQVVAKKSVRIVAYVTPPETSGDCIVRVYCVGDTPVHLETVHYEETERLGGIRVDAPKPFDFRNGGGDLLVKLTDHHCGWTNTTADMKRIRFQHIWDGIERMPSCTSVFTMADEFVSQFRATFEVKQNCQDGDEQEVVVSTAIKQRRSSVSEKSTSKNKATEQTCTCTVSGNLLKGTSANSLQDTTANVLLGAVAASPLEMAHTSSGYFSFGFEPLPAVDSLTQRIRSELIISLDPPHPKADWRTLAEDLGFKLRYIRYLESLKPPASPTDTLLNFLEARKFPLCELAKRLHGMGREDAAALLKAQLALRETEV